MEQDKSIFSGGGRSAFWLIVIVFVTILPTLHWQEFSSGSENLNVATVLEMRRSGNCLFPTLAGRARVNKPPLTAWITSAFVRPSTIEAINSAEGKVEREIAYERLAWDVRLSAWICSCLTLAAAYALAGAIARPAVGMLTVLICASGFLFFSYSRSATTDVQLMLWVTVANAGLAQAVFKGRRWGGAIVASVALGLAFMAKGPVALAMTVAPFGLFTMLDRRRGAGGALANGNARRAAGPVLVGVVIFLALASPWYLMAASRTPGVWRTWLREVSRTDATDLPSSNPFMYVMIVAVMLPWVAFMAAGLWLAGRTAWRHFFKRGTENEQSRAAGRPAAIALFLLVAPLVLMSCVRDRKQRYMLPLCVPAAMIAARATAGREEGEDEEVNPGVDSSIKWIHGLTLGGFAVGLTLAGGIPGLARWMNLTNLLTREGTPWFAPMTMAASLAVMVILLTGAWVLRRRTFALPAVSLCVMLLVQVLMIYGYTRSAGARSTLASAAFVLRDRFPAARFYTYRPDEPLRIGPNELAIYLNRTVEPLESLSDLNPSSRPVVVLQHVAKNETPPGTPTGFTSAGVIREGKEMWAVFVLQSRE